ncbi:uncharacterized protein VTP21DRAFT_3278 [Calcarisporiella thermophila]|uniref:uncharacterized protein n=1 Tax=Calcarisporiella thermophila TaxID=911321 RepID=UPI003744A62B
MAQFNPRTLTAPIAAFTMAILLGIYVNASMKEARRESMRRRLEIQQHTQQQRPQPNTDAPSKHTHVSE